MKLILQGTALIGVLVFSIFMIISQVQGDDDEQATDDEENSDTEVKDWIAVDDWEVELCTMWGGTEEQYATETEAISPELSQLTLTIQAKKKALSNSTLYEVAWYIGPLADSVEYTIIVTSETGQTKELYAGIANHITGDANYEAFEERIEYVTATIKTQEGETLSVPFIQGG